MMPQYLGNPDRISVFPLGGASVDDRIAKLESDWQIVAARYNATNNQADLATMQILQGQIDAAYREKAGISAAATGGGSAQQGQGVGDFLGQLLRGFMGPQQQAQTQSGMSTGSVVGIGLLAVGGIAVAWWLLR